MKDRIKKEIDIVFSEGDEVLAFLSMTVGRDKSSKPFVTVTWICDQATKEQGEEIEKKLFELGDIIRPIFFQT